MNGKRWRFVGTSQRGSGPVLLAEATASLGESHARVLAHLLADDTKMRIAAQRPGAGARRNPTLVHHGMIRKAAWHLLTVPPGDAVPLPLADLYTVGPETARRIAQALASGLKQRIMVMDNAATPPRLADHPANNVRPLAGGRRRIPNPDPDPVRGEIWRGRLSGSRVRVGSCSGERVIFTDLDTGNREHADLGEFKARYKAPATVQNPRAGRPGNDRNFTIHTIRTALAKRSGRPWSVTGGSGTAWGWIKLKAPPRRSTWSHRLKPGLPDWPENYEPYDTGKPGHGMSPTERQELAALMGLTVAEVGTDGISIPASSDYYDEYMDRAQGRTPERLGQPYWDNPRGSKKERADSLKVGDLVMPPDRELRLWMRRTAAEKGMSEDELGIMLTDIHEGAPDKKGRWLWFTGYLRDKWYAGGKQFPFKFKARPDTLWAVVARPTPNPGRVFGQPVPTSGLSSQIRPGDRVAYVDRFGARHTGRAVMPSSHGGWVLNMGGRYGTPAVVDDSNIVRVTRPKGRTPNPRSKPGMYRVFDDRGKTIWSGVASSIKEAIGLARKELPSDPLGPPKPWGAYRDLDFPGRSDRQNPSYRIQGTIEEVADAAPRRRPGRPRKVAPLALVGPPPPPAAPEEPAAPPQLEGRRGFLPGERVSVPYSGRGSYFGRKTHRTHEHGVVEGYVPGDEPMVHVRVRRGRSTEDHTFPERHVRRLPRSSRAAISSRLPRLKARLERKVGGDVGKAEAMILKAVAEYDAADTLAHELYPPAGTQPTREYTNARAKMRRTQEQLDALRKIVHELGGPSGLGEVPFEVAFNPSRRPAVRARRSRPGHNPRRRKDPDAHILDVPDMDFLDRDLGDVFGHQLYFELTATQRRLLMRDVRDLAVAQGWSEPRQVRHSDRFAGDLLAAEMIRKGIGGSKNLLAYVHSLEGMQRKYGTKKNPRDPERERAAKTFELWHEFPHHKITKLKVPFTRWPRHLVKLGEVVRIDYQSNKWEGKNRTYTHTTRRPRPILVTDPDAKTVNLVGGAMRPTADGLVN